MTIARDEESRTPAHRRRPPPASKSLLGRSASLPVSDVVRRAALFVRAFRPKIVAALVSVAWILVLQWLAPVIDRDPGRIEIGTVPAVRFVSRRADQGLKAFGRRGIIAHRDSIAGERC